MIYINEYKVLPTLTFKEELGEIIYYLKNKLKEPIIAKKFYNEVIKKVNTLNFMPHRFKKIEPMYNKNRILREIQINNYNIIYEIKDDTQEVLIIHIFYKGQNYLNKL